MGYDGHGEKPERASLPQTYGTWNKAESPSLLAVSAVPAVVIPVLYSNTRREKSDENCGSM